MAKNASIMRILCLLGAGASAIGCAANPADDDSAKANDIVRVQSALGTKVQFGTIFDAGMEIRFYEILNPTGVDAAALDWDRRLRREVALRRHAGRGLDLLALLQQGRGPLVHEGLHERFPCGRQEPAHSAGRRQEAVHARLPERGELLEGRLRRHARRHQPQRVGRHRRRAHRGHDSRRRRNKMPACRTRRAASTRCTRRRRVRPSPGRRSRTSARST